MASSRTEVCWAGPGLGKEPRRRRWAWAKEEQDAEGSSVRDLGSEHPFSSAHSPGLLEDFRLAQQHPLPLEWDPDLPEPGASSGEETDTEDVESVEDTDSPEGSTLPLSWPCQQDPQSYVMEEEPEEASGSPEEAEPGEHSPRWEFKDGPSPQDNAKTSSMALEWGEAGGYRDSGGQAGGNRPSQHSEVNPSVELSSGRSWSSGTMSLGHHSDSVDSTWEGEPAVPLSTSLADTLPQSCSHHLVHVGDGTGDSVAQATPTEFQGASARPPKNHQYPAGRWGRDPTGLPSSQPEDQTWRQTKTSPKPLPSRLTGFTSHLNSRPRLAQKDRSQPRQEATLASHPPSVASMYGRGRLNYPLPDFSKVGPRVRFPKDESYRPPKSKRHNWQSQGPPGPLIFKSPAEIVREVLLSTDKVALDKDPVARVPQEFQSPEQATKLVHQLQEDYHKLLTKYAEAENTIDQLRLRAKVNLYSDPPQPRHSVHAGTVSQGTKVLSFTIPQPRSAEWWPGPAQEPRASEATGWPTAGGELGPSSPPSTPALGWLPENQDIATTQPSTEETRVLASQANQLLARVESFDGQKQAGQLTPQDQLKVLPNSGDARGATRALVPRDESQSRIYGGTEERAQNTVVPVASQAVTAGAQPSPPTELGAGRHERQPPPAGRWDAGARYPPPPSVPPPGRLLPLLASVPPRRGGFLQLRAEHAVLEAKYLRAPEPDGSQGPHGEPGPGRELEAAMCHLGARLEELEDHVSRAQQEPAPAGVDVAQDSSLAPPFPASLAHLPTPPRQAPHAEAQPPASGPCAPLMDEAVTPGYGDGDAEPCPQRHPAPLRPPGPRAEQDCHGLLERELRVKSFPEAPRAEEEDEEDHREENGPCALNSDALGAEATSTPQGRPRAQAEPGRRLPLLRPAVATSSPVRGPTGAECEPSQDLEAPGAAASLVWDGESVEQRVSVKPPGVQTSTARERHLPILRKAEAALPGMPPAPVGTRAIASPRGSLDSLAGSGLSEPLVPKALCQADGALPEELWMASPETDSGFVGSETSRISPLTQTPEHRLSHLSAPGTLAQRLTAPVPHSGAPHPKTRGPLVPERAAEPSTPRHRAPSRSSRRRTPGSPLEQALEAEMGVPGLEFEGQTQTSRQSLPSRTISPVPTAARAAVPPSCGPAEATPSLRLTRTERDQAIRELQAEVSRLRLRLEDSLHQSPRSSPTRPASAFDRPTQAGEEPADSLATWGSHSASKSTEWLSGDPEDAEQARPAWRRRARSSSVPREAPRLSLRSESEPLSPRLPSEKVRTAEDGTQAARCGTRGAGGSRQPDRVSFRGQYTGQEYHILPPRVVPRGSSGAASCSHCQPGRIQDTGKDWDLGSCGCSLSAVGWIAAVWPDLSTGVEAGRTQAVLGLKEERTAQDAPAGRRGARRGRTTLLFIQFRIFFDPPMGVGAVTRRAQLVAGPAACRACRDSAATRNPLGLPATNTLPCPLCGQPGSSAEGDGLDSATSGAEKVTTRKEAPPTSSPRQRGQRAGSPARPPPGRWYLAAAPPAPAPAAFAYVSPVPVMPFLPATVYCAPPAPTSTPAASSVRPARAHRHSIQLDLGDLEALHRALSQAARAAESVRSTTRQMRRSLSADLRQARGLRGSCLL
ncbi:microtubule organization protein AKNA [Ctenodactylus gundi]